MLAYRFTHLLVLEHKMLKCLVREASSKELAKFLVETPHFRSHFQQLDEALEVIEIQESSLSRVSLLCRP